MRRKMPRTCTRIDFSKRRIIGSQRSLGRVEAVDQKLIQTQIGSNCKTVVTRQLNLVRVRTFLSLRVRTVTAVLNYRGGLPKSAIRQHGKNRHAAGVVVGNQYIFPRLVE